MHTSRFWTRFFAAAAMLAVGATSAFATAFDDGASAYRRGDFGGALQYWRAIANTDATVQNNIGVMYMDGHGVPRNFSVALQWLARSAANGSSLGQNNLGGLYRDGRGVPRDYGKAMTFFGAAAGQGNAAGQINLGLLYLYGQGVHPDPVHAYMWFDLAARQGMRNAALNRNNAQARLGARDLAQARSLSQRCLAQGFRNCG